MPSFQLVSDLHLEFMVGDDGFPKLSREADYLILAGDVGYPTMENFIGFMRSVCEQFEGVFYVPGNHEYYCGLPKNSVDDLLSRLSREIGFILLNNSTYTFEGVRMIGSTLWSKIEPKDQAFARLSVNDYRRIKLDEYRTVTPQDTNCWHEEARKFLREQFSIPGDKLVITHYLPSMELIHDRYRGNRLNCCFASSLEDLFLASDVGVWCAGHTHQPIRRLIDQTRFYVNPVGYRGENPYPHPTLVFRFEE